MDLEGTVVAGRYEVLGLLGEGGMGVVYRARAVADGQIVALKFPHVALLADQSFRSRFTREMKALAQLKHDHLVPVIEVGEWDSRPFVVMQYLGGGNLRQCQRSEPLRTRVGMIDWVPPIASALDYLHSRGVIHRDVKPENILFSTEGKPYLVDLGAIKVQENSSLDAYTRTKEGLAVGTLAYMAPEVLLGRSFDGRIDQYALGVVVYELLLGKVPFAATSVGELIRAHISGPPEQLFTQLTNLPEVGKVIARALCRDPTRRYSCCTEFATALRNAWQQESAVKASHSTTSVRAASTQVVVPAPQPVLTPPVTAPRLNPGQPGAGHYCSAPAGPTSYPTQLPPPVPRRTPPPVPKHVGSNRSVDLGSKLSEVLKHTRDRLRHVREFIVNMLRRQ
jgi:serine/threonine protein kinase